MDLAEILKDLRSEGIEIWVKADRLQVRAPRGMSERRRSEIRSMREPLLAYLRGEEANSANPLSFAQRALLYLDRFEAAGGAYNLSIGVRVTGPLDLLALHAAFVTVIDHHEVLRSRFVWNEGAPFAVPFPRGTCDWEVVDASGWLPSKLQGALSAETVAPFQLEAEAAMRCRLFRSGECDHTLLIVVHHIAADGPSLEILFDELSRNYRRTLEHKGEIDGGTQHQGYAEHARQQHRAAQDGAFEGDLVYWAAQLRDASEAVDLPFDRKDVAEPSNAGAAVEFAWPGEMATQLRELASARGMTTFMVMLTAFQLLLHRWTGQSDISVGGPHSARPATCAGQIGNFLNTLVYRTRIDPRQSVDRLLEQVRQTVIDAFSHASVPFDIVAARVQKSRSFRANPLFNVLFSVDEVAHAELELFGVVTERVWPEQKTSKFPLSLFVSIDDRGVTGMFEYSTALFDRPTIMELAECFRVTLQGILEQPNQAAAVLPFLSPAIMEEVVERNSRTFRALAGPRTLQQLLQQSCAQHAEAIALAWQGRDYSFARLAAAADYVAARIGACAGPDRIIAFCLRRDPRIVATMMGILRSGSAYLPLDPAYPRERIDFMLRDSGASLLVTDAELAVEFDGTDREMLVLPPSLEEFRPSSIPALQSAWPQNTAYLIYTSGSTGRPKGIAITHANVTSFLAWAAEEFAEPARNGMLATTSVCFDLSLFEIFLPLVSGGRIVLFDSAISLVENEPDAGAAVLNTVPSAADALCEAQCLPPGLCVINLAGEALKPQTAERVYSALPGVRLNNLYGPSEYTTYATHCLVPDPVGPSVNIGRPIANARIYILDALGRPVLTGSPGEIFIAGEGLARGYVNRPALTAASFVPDPFGLPGTRMYATGDFGRIDRAGNVHYLGRRDQQIKLRGFRIELGEIEVRLRDCKGVDECAVLVRQTATGPVLVAHVATAQPAIANEASLRVMLEHNLPHYMQPNVWRFHETLPLNPNGKIDRVHLRSLDSSNGLDRAHYAPPRNASESYMVEVWRDVLRVEKVGLDDNFFELGGHSLLATAIVARLSHERFPGLTLRDIFLYPTPRQLVEHLAHSGRRSAEKIPAVERPGPTPASYAQQRLWFLDQLEPESTVYNLCVAWRFAGKLDVAILQRCLEEIVRRHEILRTVFAPDADAIPMQIVGESYMVNMPVWDVSGRPDPEAAALEILAEDSAVPFSLAEGPLFRAGLVHVADDMHILQIGMPHIISDGWSLDVILSELGALYPAFLEGRSSPLEPLPIQFGDYCKWEQERLAGADLDRHLTYFLNRLEQVPSFLDLPTDRPRPPVASYQGEVHEFALDGALSERLRQYARQHQVSLFMVMTAVFAVLLGGFSRQRDFCLGYSVGNRTRIETEGLIGAFVNTLVYRASLDPQLSFSAYVTQVCDQMLASDEHQEFPFEKLVEELNPLRSLSHHPLFQATVSFSTTHGPRSRKTRTLRGVGEKEVSLPGIALSLVEPPYETAKFDLALFVSETGEEIEGDIEFATDLFDRGTIAELAKGLVMFCRMIASEPQVSVGDLFASLHVLDLPQAGERQELFLLGKTVPLAAALSDPAMGKDQSVRAVPQTLTEKALAQIWSDILGRPCLDRNASFFAVGGHSMSAMKLMLHIRHKMGVSIPLRAIFDTPHLAGLARKIDETTLTDSKPASAAIPILPRPRGWAVHAVETGAE